MSLSPSEGDGQKGYTMCSQQALSAWCVGSCDNVNALVVVLDACLDEHPTSECFPTYSWKLCKDNLESAKKARETYFNRRAKRREFAIGDEVLVKFPKVPRGVNPKFFKKWRGGFRVVRRVGPLNLVVRSSPHSKTILVHVDRVRHMSPTDRLVHFDSTKGKDSKFTDPAVDSDEDFKPVRYYSPEESFPPMSPASSSDEELAVSRPASPASGASEVERIPVPNVFPDLPADRVNVMPDGTCLLYTSPSPRDLSTSRMPSSA